MRLGWILVTVSTGKVDALRVFAWRRLRGLGAVYLARSTCLLPDLPQVVEAVDAAIHRIRTDGGSARMIRIEVTDATEDEQLRASQRAERDVEYGEVVERTEQFLTEIATETARQRFTYAEVEESEADLARFERWLASVEARDYFDAGGRGAAHDAVQRCREALAAFEASAIAAADE